jgi:nucleoid-associated protein YgaU
VDLYEPKQGDTWESISREFYNDTRYATALKSVNFNKPLTSGGTVDIPPLYILKQKFQTSTRTTSSSSQTSPVPGSAPNWAPPATTTTPAAPSSGSQIYRVPAGGTSERELAKKYLGNEQRWMEIFNLNQHITAPDNIPAGTEVRLPMDAKLP